MTGTEIGLLSQGLSGASLGGFLLAPACPIEKVTLRVGFLYIMSGSETNESVARDRVLPELRVEPGTPGPKPSALPIRLFLPHSDRVPPIFYRLYLTTTEWACSG